MSQDNDKQTTGGLKKDPALFTGMAEFKLKKGVPKKRIVDDLVEKGLGRNEAVKVVDRTHARLLSLAEKQRVTFLSVIGAIGAGGAGAAVGAYLWRLWETWSSGKVGFSVMIIFIGFLAGIGSLLGSGKRRGLGLQIVAVILTLVAVCFGEYITGGDFYDCKTVIPVAHDFDKWSADYICIVKKMPANVFKDIIWVAAALVLALWIPRRKKKDEVDLSKLDRNL